ncbi:MAG: glycosyltransferase family 9 protein [Myxococcota bacterium]|nr:glycosyltransferase family 9 protein [Myxococcota bacterium]
MSTVVIRYSSLGDIVLTGTVTAALAPVTFITHPRYRPLAEALPGVVAVCAGDDPLPRAADRIIDLHASLRSVRTARAIRGPVRRVRRHDLRRRARVHLKLGAPPPTVVHRYAEAAGVSPASAPWLPVAGPADALLLCPGSAWPTKAWAADRFAALGSRYPGPVIVLGGPDEVALVGDIAEAIGARAEFIAEKGFEKTLAAMGRGRVAVAGDSGLMHLCAAAGVPVVGIFGPTTSSDGFWCHAGEVVALDLPCRPCSRYGGPACPFGDHLCMRGLTVDRVWDAVQRTIS